MNQSISLIFFIDYVPLLMRKHKTAVILYLLYDRIKNLKNEVEISYQEIEEQFGISSDTVRTSNKVLCQLNLIDIMPGDSYSNKYIVKGIEPLDKEKREKFFKQVDRKPDTKFREIYLRKVKSCFRDKLSIREQKDYYESLLNLSKIVPMSQWKSQELLSYFCNRYQEKYNTKFVFADREKIYKGKEIRDLHILTTRFDNIQDIVNYLNWIFDVKISENLNGLERTGILHHNALINEYLRRKSSGTLANIKKQKGTDPIDKNFIEWVKKNVSEYLGLYPLETLRDLYWCIEAKESGEAEECVLKVITEAEKRGIIQRGQQLSLK